MTGIKILIPALAAGAIAFSLAGWTGTSYAARSARENAAAADYFLSGEEIGKWDRLSESNDFSADRRPRRKARTASPSVPPKLSPSPAVLPPEEPEEEEATTGETGTGRTPVVAAPQSPRPTVPHPPPPAAQYGRLPPHFTRNDGQLPVEVGYYLKGPRGTVYLTTTELVFDFFSQRPQSPERALPPGEEPPEEKAEDTAISRLVFRLRFPDAGPQTVLEGSRELPGKINYFVGARENWRTSIPTYEEVVYRGLYPGIDLACLFTDGNLAYRYTVAPAADPGRIVFDYSGVEGLEINPAGDLIVLTPFGGFRTPAPRAYQEIEGRRAERTAAFVLSDATTAALEIAPYDHAHPLVIEF